MRPQFPWTDRKLKVHFFMFVLTYLMSTIPLSEARKGRFKRSTERLLDERDRIRLTIYRAGRKTGYQIGRLQIGRKGRR
jgi:hypothetical protein